MKHKIVIIGGGFAGIQAARKLARFSFNDSQITLISNKTYFEYYPGLYRVVTSASPIEIAIPLSDVLPKNVDIINDVVHIVDPIKKEIICRDNIYEYDTLILGLGSELNDFGIPGVKEHSYTFRSVKDALKIKNAISNLVLSCPRSGLPEACYQVVVVGGGATGVELAGDIISHLEDLVEKTGVSKNVVQVSLVDAGPRILGNLPEEVGLIAKRKLEKMGVVVRNDIRISAITQNSVIAGELVIPARLTIWSGGVKPNSLYQTIPNISLSKNGKVIVDEYMRALPYENIYIIGDGADTPKSGLAQTALTDGLYVAGVINNGLIGIKPKKYKSKFVAHAIPIGSKDCVFSVGDLTFSGRLAYLLRHFIDFDFFAGWLSLPKMLDLFFDGYKYRKLHENDEERTG
jgi:NADH:ubiquinone reductase (H+-translocating)